MRVLVTWGSKMGGTAGIGRMLEETLRSHGFDVVAVSAEEVHSLEGVDAALIGGALYANRWPANVRRFVQRNIAGLRHIPVWLFSSGPLDDSADRAEIPPPLSVGVLGERIGALGHVTFGGRLAADAKGFPARAMAKTSAGDFRNPARIRGWADGLAQQLPSARPGEPIEHPARSLSRLLGFGVLGWALCLGAVASAFPVTGPAAATAVHSLATSLFFAGVGWRYFRARGSRDPLPTASTWTTLTIVLDSLVAFSFGPSVPLFRSVFGTFLPYLLLFVATWATGFVVSTMSWPEHAPLEHGQPTQD